MILNHKAAIKYMFDNLSDIDTDRKTTKDVHVLLSHDLPNIQPNEEGSYRHRAVTISHSAYVPLDISYQIEEEMAFLFDKLILIDDPFEKSLFILAMISYIQPFIDVNNLLSAGSIWSFSDFSQFLFFLNCPTKIHALEYRGNVKLLAVY